MQYVEIMRARRVLFWYTLVIAACVVLTAISLYAGRADVHVGNGTIPLTAIFAGCTMAAFIVASCVAPGLTAEASTIAISWTRPTARDAIAWWFVAVDVAAIVVGYVVLLLAFLLVLGMVGMLGRIAVDPSAWQALVLGIGAALMWYGIVAAVAARLPGRGALVAGMSWAVFLIVAGLWNAPLPPLLHGILTALNYLNPLAYYSGYSSGGERNMHHAIALDATGRMIAVWCIAGAAMAANVRLWSTREA